jgi:CDP-diacylglycerol---glycerol-3-phosphate 3-phosphatidyltransferase
MTASRVQVAVFGMAAVSLVAYAILGARDRDADRRGTQFVLGLGNFLLHWLLWLLGPVERFSLRLGATPDFFNVAGVALSAAGGVLVARGHLETAGWIIAAGGLCDILDGRIARARAMASPYGTFIDSTLDRFAEVFVLLGFVYYLRDFSAGPLVAAAAIGGSLLVSYARARGESLDVLCKDGLMRRGERIVVLFLVCMLDGPITSWSSRPAGSVALWGIGLMAAGTFVTAAHRTVSIARRLRARGGR